MSYTRSEVGLMFVDVYNNEAKAYELWAMTFTKDVNGKWMADGYFEPLYARSDGSWVDDYGATYTVTGPETIELGSMPNAFIQTGGGTLTLNKTVLSYGVQYEKVYDEIDSNYTFVFHDNNTVTVNNGSTSKTLTVSWDAPLFCYIEGYGYLYVEYDGYGVDYASYNKELF
jgi:hypothetical protein